MPSAAYYNVYFGQTRDVCYYEREDGGMCGDDGELCDFHSQYEMVSCLAYPGSKSGYDAGRWLSVADLRYQYRRGV